MRLRRRRLDRGRRLLKHDDRIALPAAPWNVNLRRRRRLHRQRRPRRRRIFLAHLTSLLLSHRQLTLNRRLSLKRIHKHRMAHGNLRSPRDRKHPTKHRARAERHREPDRHRDFFSRVLLPRPPTSFKRHLHVRITHRITPDSTDRHRALSSQTPASPLRKPLLPVALLGIAPIARRARARHPLSLIHI